MDELNEICVFGLRPRTPPVYRHDEAIVDGVDDGAEDKVRAAVEEDREVVPTDDDMRMRGERVARVR